MFGGDSLNKQGFLKGSAILLISTVITKVLGLVYRIVLTRFLGGTGMGCFAGTFSVFTPVMAVFVAGIPSTMARAAAENYAFERFENLRKTKRVAMVLFCTASFIASLAVAAASLPLSKYIPSSGNSWLPLACAAPTLIFCTAMSVLRGYYEGLHNMYPTAVSEMIETVFKLLLGLGFAYAARLYAAASFEQTGTCFGIVCKDAAAAQQAALPFITAAAIAGTSLSSGIACVYIILYNKLRGDGITRQMLHADKVTEPSKEISRKLLACCMPIALTALITTLAGMIDMLTVAPCLMRTMKKAPHIFDEYLTESVTPQMLPNFIYGSYEGLAAAVAGLVPTLTAMLGKSVLPSAAESRAKGDSKAVAGHINKMMSLCALIAFPSGLGISLFSEDILRLLFSGRNAEIAAGAPNLRVLGAAVTLMSLSLPCFTLLMTLGRSRSAVLIMLVGSAIKLGGNLLFISIPKLSVIGPSLSDVVSEGFICIAALVCTYHLVHSRPDWRNVFIKPAYGAVMSVSAAVLLRSALHTKLPKAFSSSIITVLCIIFSVIMYLFVMVLLCEMPKNVLKSLFCKKNRKNT